MSMSYNFYNPPHQTISVEINNGELITNKGTQFEDRNGSMERILHSIKDKLFLEKNKKFIINTGDHPIDKGNHPYPVLSFSTVNDFKDIPIPCFVYDHWKGARIPEWEIIVDSLSKKGEMNPKINKTVWIGAPTNHIRVQAMEKFSPHEDLIYFKLMNWGEVRSGKEEVVYLSLEDHLNYKLLLDLPGNGFSARIYYFMFCKRPIIKLYDSHKLWFDRDLPENTILRANNLSDILEISKKLLIDEEFYNMVVYNTWKFAENYMTKEKSMDYLAKVINELPFE